MADALVCHTHPCDPAQIKVAILFDRGDFLQLVRIFFNIQIYVEHEENHHLATT